MFIPKRMILKTEMLNPCVSYQDVSFDAKPAECSVSIFGNNNSVLVSTILKILHFIDLSCYFYV